MDTVRESALEVDTGRKSLLHWGLEPMLVLHLHLAFQLNALPTELSPPHLADLLTSLLTDGTKYLKHSLADI